MTTRNTPNKRTLDQRDAQDDDDNKPNNANLAQYEPAEKRQRLAEDTLHEKVLVKKQQNAESADEKRSDDQADVFRELIVVHREHSAVLKTNEILRRKVARFVAKHTALTKRLAELGDAPVGPIHCLPDEMRVLITQQLSITDTLTCERVCQWWRKVVVKSVRVINAKLFNDGVANAHVKGFVKFSNLESLSLERCKDVSEISMPALASLANLKELDLFGCKMKNFSPLAGLAKLRTLRIADSDLVEQADLATLPPQLTKLTLEWLHALQGTACAYLSHMVNLTDLKIADCDFLRSEGMILPATLAPTLKCLSVYRQGWFLDDSLAALSGFENVRELNLYQVPISGNSFSALKDKLPALETLRLLRCYIMSNTGFTTMVDVVKDTVRNFAFTGKHQVTREGLAHLRYMTKLEKLFLRCGDLDMSPDFDFLANMKLNELVLVDCDNISRENLETLVETQADTLQELRIYDCDTLRGRDLVCLQGLPKIRLFNFYNWRNINSGLANADTLTVTMVPGGGMTLEVAGGPESEDEDEDDDEDDEDDDDDDADDGDAEDKMLVPVVVPNVIPVPTPTLNFFRQLQAQAPVNPMMMMVLRRRFPPAAPIVQVEEEDADDEDDMDIVPH